MTMVANQWSLAELLPHAAPMLLLDALQDYTSDGLTALADIRADHPFLTKDGVAVHVGIELMAQACGAFVGLRGRLRGEPIKLGFILGTRGFTASVCWFRLGDRLAVTVAPVFLEDEMGVFDCRISRDGAGVAEAQISVFQPRDATRAAAILGSGRA